MRASSSSRPVSFLMNYRHAFHAGGFADVIKHVVLVRILTYLQDKQAPFRVIDTHAGAGLYDLTGDEARRGGDWLTGIARLMPARFSETTAPLIKPYLDIVRAFNRPGELEAYPGSPLIARALLRPQDRLTACEVEPKARKRLIDALRRDSDQLARHVAGVAGSGATSGNCLRLEFSVAPQAAEPGLTSAGVLIANPPWTLAGELRAILPELEKPLGRGGAGRFRLETPKA